MKKYIGYVLLLVAVGVVWYVLTSYKESFVPEFLEQSGVRKTAQTMKSSYAQQTNHMVNTPVIEEPIPGMETPFRVNMFNSFQPA